MKGIRKAVPWATAKRARSEHWASAASVQGERRAKPKEPSFEKTFDLSGPGTVAPLELASAS